MDPLRPIVDWITRLELGQPTRVGVDPHRQQAKPHWLMRWLRWCKPLRIAPVLRASIDDFHRPGHKFRSMREEWTPQAYYDEGYDYLAFRDLLLRPLGAGGDHRVRTAIFDSLHDVQVPDQWQLAPEHTILLVH